MLKHISIPSIPPPSSSVVGSSASNTFVTTPTSRPSRPLLTLNRSQQPLNVSTLTTASNITSNGGPSLLQTYSNTPLLTHSFPESVQTKPLQNGHAPRMFTPLPALSTNSQQHLLKNYNNNYLHNNNACNTTSSSLSSKLFAPENSGAREALTSLGLLCLGESSMRAEAPSVLTPFTFTCSLASSCLIVADIFAENLAGHKSLSQHSPAVAGILVPRGVRDRVRRHARPLRLVAVAQPVLSVGVRHPIPVRCRTCPVVTCHSERKVSFVVVCVSSEHPRDPVDHTNF